MASSSGTANVVELSGRLTAAIESVEQQRAALESVMSALAKQVMDLNRVADHLHAAAAEQATVLVDLDALVKSGGAPAAFSSALPGTSIAELSVVSLKAWPRPTGMRSHSSSAAASARAAASSAFAASTSAKKTAAGLPLISYCSGWPSLLATQNAGRRSSSACSCGQPGPSTLASIETEPVRVCKRGAASSAPSNRMPALRLKVAAWPRVSNSSPPSVAPPAIASCTVATIRPPPGSTPWRPGSGDTWRG